MRLDNQHQREQLARRLHDELQQLLAAARLKAALVKKMNPPCEHDLGQIEQLLDAAVAETRSIIAGLLNAAD